jgi:predicted trehalose synthase
MQRIVWISICGLLILPLAVIAGKVSGDSCLVGEKVASLLSSWQTALDEMKALGAEAREELKTRLAGFARECPIGSRLGATFAAVRDVLGASISAEEAN